HLPHCVGAPLWGVESRVFDLNGSPCATDTLGEICVRGHNVMAGYYRNEAADAESFRDGWFRTGDIGRIDDAGRIYIHDRCKDVIIRGGTNVYPAEVEQAMAAHAAIERVAVFGQPHDRLGEEIAAAV